MSNIPEQPRYSIHGKPIEFIRRKIVRAERWSDLFDTKEEENDDFLDNIVGALIQEYRQNGSVDEYTIDDSDGVIHVLERPSGLHTKVQKSLATGNVSLSFSREDSEPNTSYIVPEVGNIAHGFSKDNTIFPSYDKLKLIPIDELEIASGTHMTALMSYQEGKPATEGWEDLFLYNDQFPQRIGHRIFPQFILEAQSNLREAFPELFDVA